MCPCSNRRDKTLANGPATGRLGSSCSATESPNQRRGPAMLLQTCASWQSIKAQKTSAEVSDARDSWQLIQYMLQLVTYTQCMMQVTVYVAVYNSSKFQR